MDLSSPPPPKERTETSDASRASAARNGFVTGLALIRAGAGRAGSAAVGHLQPVVSAAVTPLRRIAPAWESAAERVGAHPLASRAAVAARRAGALPMSS